MNEPSPIALFRCSVLGGLLHRELARGELRQEIARLADREYAIPGSTRTRIGPKTLEGWYYASRREGLDGLEPKPRADRGVSKLPAAGQEAILRATRDHPRRSIRQLRLLMEHSGQVASGALSRSAIHRLLQAYGLARPSGAASEPVERRAFVAESAGELGYGEVMHGPRLWVNKGWRKGDLVSLWDDAARLAAHSAFALAEGALEIEGVLQQAILKRGRPKKLVVDNGAAYRAHTLQAVWARLGIQLIYCRPYAPASKGKLERWHRPVRDQLLSEIELAQGLSLDAQGLSLGAATPLAARAHLERPRARAIPADSGPLSAPRTDAGPALVDLAVERSYSGQNKEGT